MFKKLIFLTLLLRLYIPSAHAEANCKYKNLMEDNWNKMRNMVREQARFVDMPAYDQGRTGTCYAFAGIQLADYWRQSHGQRFSEEIRLGSPIYTAMVFKQAEGTWEDFKDIDGGFIVDSIKALKKYGFCPKDVVNGAIRKFLEGHKIRLRKGRRGRRSTVEDDTVFAELTNGFINRQTGSHGGDGNSNSIDPSTVTWKEYYKWARSRRRSETIQNLPKRIIKKVYRAFEPYMKKGQTVQFLNKVLHVCKRKKLRTEGLRNMPKVRKFKVNRFRNLRDRNNKYGNMIRTLLEKKNAPAIGISYCSAVLNDPRYVAYDNRGRVKDYDSCGGHASIIVGKRTNRGKCQYLLKNTWNSSDICDTHGGCIYRKMKDLETGQSYKEEVGVWIDEKRLLNNLWWISYIYPDTRTERRIEAKLKKTEGAFNFALEAFQDLYYEKARRAADRWGRGR